jgi:hypothetical protein
MEIPHSRYPSLLEVCSPRGVHLYTCAARGVDLARLSSRAKRSESDCNPWMSKSLRTEVYFCHQNQNAKNIGNFTTPLKPHNIGTHLKGKLSGGNIIFEILSPLGELYHFLKFSQNTINL